ncbi:RcpC/CpaB family pilus assembly protein [Bacillaceae bacterium CLA-AA-H227]|uniref:RcpC/CpaB family pilus assembly protein n=1 Tax=Robertmurraya yapensis (ex Hitch et al 2024) TaxID=3133160 RepID=A0ACC6SG94_9BACI
MKKTLWRKRLVTMLMVAALIISILAYTNFTIKAEINEADVVVTKVDIPPRTEITKEMLEVITVPTQGIPTNAVRNMKDVVGKWTVAGYGTPANSFIYDNKIIPKSEMPDAGILSLKENEVAFPLLVDLETSLGNSIIPNSEVDLYFRSLIETGSQSKKAVYGKLASQIRVLSVKDADASNVFDPEGYQKGVIQENTNEKKNALAKIYIFAIPVELNELVNKAKLLGDVVPIATGQASNEEVTEQSDVMTFINESSFEKETNQNEGEE